MTRYTPDWRTRIERAEDRSAAWVTAALSACLRAISLAASASRRGFSSRLQHAERASLLGVYAAVAQCCLLLTLACAVFGWLWLAVSAAALLALLLIRPEWLRVAAAVWLNAVARLHFAARWMFALGSILAEALRLRVRSATMRHSPNEKRGDRSPRHSLVHSSVQSRPHSFSEADF